jgi:two-component system LytT family response regulator
MPLSFLIVDDEQLSRNYIEDLLKELDPTCMIAGSVGNTETARQILKDHEVDVIFLDIKMPDESGIQFLERLPSKHLYKTVFITAYNDYAIKAIKEAAFDYILKPIDKEEFCKTFKRLTISSQEDKLGIKIDPEHYEKASITLHHNGGFKLVLIKDIIYLQASSNYTLVKLVDGTSITVSKPLKEFDQKLNKSWFFRVHKSYLINMHFMQEYLSEGGGKVLLKTGQEIYISKYKLNDFFAAVGRLTKGLKA